MGLYIEDLHLFETSRRGVFENIFVFVSIQVCIPFRNLIPGSHLGQITVVSIWYWDGVDLNNDSGIQ